MTETHRCLMLTSNAYACTSLGDARKAGDGYADWVWWFEAREKLTELTFMDVRRLIPTLPKNFGGTTQGDALHDITPEQVEILRAANAERLAAKAAAQAAEDARRRQMAALIGSIPAELQERRMAMMREYRRGMNGDADGYNPYITWEEPGPRGLLRRYAPDIAVQLDALLGPPAAS